MDPASRQVELNSRPVLGTGRLVLYWMQQAQRAEDNHALDYAVTLANQLQVPVVAAFVLVPDYPQANLRHYTFMLQGLRETAQRLGQQGVGRLALWGDPVTEILTAAQRVQAAAVITDRGYLRHQRRWRERIAARLPVRMVEVDAGCVIPCTAFAKEEYAAHTLRRKYHRLLPYFLAPYVPPRPRRAAPEDPAQAFDLADPEGTLRRLRPDPSVLPVPECPGGPVAAERRLSEFLGNQLESYAERRQDAAGGSGSRLSPYLHYGQISALRVALEARAAHGNDHPGVQPFLEELLVRRELAINFVWHNDRYDSTQGWPQWARRSLEAHRTDPRPALYSPEQLAAAATDDVVWNAAQKELLAAGHIHNYPRMLWAKRLLEWTSDPEQAWEIGVWLNDRYALDGRDPNGFANLAWCLGGKHDRPWPSRPIYGQVRYMSTARAGKHFAVAGYLARVNALCRQAGLDPVTHG